MRLSEQHTYVYVRYASFDSRPGDYRSSQNEHNDILIDYTIIFGCCQKLLSVYLQA
jgi:hypothetical protein